jgi:hypothetical protein
MEGVRKTAATDFTDNTDQYSAMVSSDQLGWDGMPCVEAERSRSASAWPVPYFSLPLFQEKSA